MALNLRLQMLALLLLPISAVGAAQSNPSPAASAQQQPSPCQAARHREFDFWVGHWDVYVTDTDQMIGRNLIENLYNGCVIRENFMPFRGAGGGSLNSYRPSEQRWRQSYTGGGNAWTEYFGGMDGKDMVLTATVMAQSGERLVRMRFSPMADGSVRQHGTFSTDGGKSWQDNYDFTYRRSASAAAAAGN